MSPTPLIVKGQLDVKGQLLPVRDVVVPPLRDQTIRLLSEEIEHKKDVVEYDTSQDRGQQIEHNSQDRGQHMEVAPKAIELSLDTDVGQEVISKSNLDTHHQEDYEESRNSSNNTGSSETSVEKYEMQRGLKDEKLRRQKYDDPIPDGIVVVNQTKIKSLHVEHGSGVLDGDKRQRQQQDSVQGSLKHQVQDRSKGSPYFWRRVDEYCNLPNKPVNGEEGMVVSVLSIFSKKVTVLYTTRFL